MTSHPIELDFRLAKAEDLKNLIEPVSNYLNFADKGLNRESLEPVIAYILNSSNSGIIIVCSESGIIGFAIFSITFSFESLDRFLILCLEDLWVNVDFRGLYIGTKLFNKVEEVAKKRGCSAIIGLVDSTNKPLLSFWGRLGARIRTEILMKKLF